MTEEMVLNAALWVELILLSAVCLGHALVPKDPQFTLENLLTACRDYTADDEAMAY